MTTAIITCACGAETVEQCAGLGPEDMGWSGEESPVRERRSETLRINVTQGCQAAKLVLMERAPERGARDPWW